MMQRQGIQAKLGVAALSEISMESGYVVFSRSIGCVDSFMAELWGLRDGLTLCIDLQLTAVDV